MSAPAAASAQQHRLSRTVAFLGSQVGRKLIMAVTGAVLFGFTVGHMLGNLQIYLGARQINAYAAALKGMGLVLWGVRAVLLLCFVLHVWAAITLHLESRAARPVRYRRQTPTRSTWASRTMLTTGLILLVYVVYHLLHFTTGTVHPSFSHTDVYGNLVTGFRAVPVALGYVVANALLGAHLLHGAWSMSRSVGIGHPGYTARIRQAAYGFAGLVAFGNVSIPIAVLTGVVK